MNKEKQEIEDLGIEESAGFKNLIAIRDYTRATRQMFRELQEENKLYKNQVLQQSQAIDQLRKQLNEILAVVYSNNATSR